MGDNGMPPAPGWRKCTAYRRPGAGGMPLALHLAPTLGVMKNVLRALCAAFSLTLAQGSALAAGAVAFSSFAGFPLWTTTLDQVQQSLGPTETEVSGDASTSLTSICYATKAGYVTFYSGEIGGGTKLEGVMVSEERRQKQCATHTHRRLALQMNGLKLGMSKKAFTALAPSKVEWQGDTARASKVARRSGRISSLSVGAEFRSDNLTMFYVSRHGE